MFETITTTYNKTFKEIDNKHTVICIEDVSVIKINSYGYSTIKWYVEFYINNTIYSPFIFKT